MWSPHRTPARSPLDDASQYPDERPVTHRLLAVPSSVWWSGGPLARAEEGNERNSSFEVTPDNISPSGVRQTDRRGRRPVCVRRPAAAADGLNGDMHFAHCAVDLSTWLMERRTIRNGTTDIQACEQQP